MSPYPNAVEKLATYNLDEAKAIMTSKGYSESNMLKLTYTYNDNTMHKNVAQAMQASMKEANFSTASCSSRKSPVAPGIPFGINPFNS